VEWEALNYYVLLQNVCFGNAGPSTYLATTTEDSGPSSAGTSTGYKSATIALAIIAGVAIASLIAALIYIFRRTEAHGICLLFTMNLCPVRFHVCLRFVITGRTRQQFSARDCDAHI